MGRFTNTDNYASTGQGFLGYNMYTYCGNNPVVRYDPNGNAWETPFDFISLGISVADVVMNPCDPWAWAGLVGDAADVLIPFVGGIGEAIKVYGSVQDTRDVVSAAKKIRHLVSDSVGTYQIQYKSGKSYVGKGSFSRAITSALDHTKQIQLNNYLGDEVTSITWRKATSASEAYMQEYLWQHKGDLVLSVDKTANTYNQIWSPGRKYLGWE